MSNIRPMLLLLSAAFIVAGAATLVPATTLIDFSVEDLIRWSTAGVRATVLDKGLQDELHTRYTLRVDEVLHGPVATSSLTLSLDHTIEGMPDLGPGDQLVLFLNPDNKYERIIGLKWATYRVEDGKIYDYERRAVELRAESRDDKTRLFVRPADDPARASTSYADFKVGIDGARQRLALEQSGTTPSPRHLAPRE